MKCVECFNSEVDYPYVLCWSCYKRQKRGVGSGGPTGFAAAKRAEKPGGPEEEGAKPPKPQSLAVSPGQALAALELAIVAVEEDAAFYEMQADKLHATRQLEEAGKARRKAAGRREAIRVLRLLAGAEAGQRAVRKALHRQTSSMKSLPLEDSNNGTASGRRTAKVCGPESPKGANINRNNNMGLITITERWTDATFSSERLVGDAGSVALTCCAGREADKQQVRAEDSPQSLAVAPGEAKLRALILCVQEVLRVERDVYGVPVFWWWLPDVWRARGVRETIARLIKDVRQIEGIAVKPDSEAPEERSGRRNDSGLATAPQDPVS